MDFTFDTSGSKKIMSQLGEGLCTFKFPLFFPKLCFNVENFCAFFSKLIRKSSGFDFRSGTRMVVRRPDGLGTARVRTTQVGATHPVSTGPISEIDIKMTLASSGHIQLFKGFIQQ